MSRTPNGIHHRDTEGRSYRSYRRQKADEILRPLNSEPRTANPKKGFTTEYRERKVRNRFKFSGMFDGGGERRTDLNLTLGEQRTANGERRTVNGER